MAQLMTKTTAQNIVEHLAELRRRIIWVLLYFITAFIIGLIYIEPLVRFLIQPVAQPLVVLGPNDVLWVYVSIAGLVALTASLPFGVYHLWRYVEPALSKRESFAVFGYIPAVFVCFVCGWAFGFWIVVPALLDVLLSLGRDVFVTQLTVQNYLSFVFNVTLPIACMFELPVISALLTRVYLLKSKWLVHYRRYAYFILLVLAVCLTPADFVSDLVMFVPLFLLYEISIIVSRWIEHKQAKGR